MCSTTRMFPQRSWRFICVSSAFMLLSWRLNYALPIYQHSKHFITRFSRFLQNAPPIKARWANYIHKPGQGAAFTLSGEVCKLLLPRLLLPKLLLPPPSECRAEAPLRMNSMEKKTSFMKSVVHDCQVNHSYWNYDIIHLV